MRKPRKKLPDRPPRSVSDGEVARFLRHLAAIYKDRRTGNPALAEALNRVAEKLMQAYTTSGREEAAQGSLLAPDMYYLRGLDTEAVSRFISDDRKTKVDLIALAAARFSMPTSKLLRLKLPEVRDAIRAALQHEDSLKIITQEAERNGSARRS